jgi:hypothetical protein
MVKRLDRHLLEAQRLEPRGRHSRARASAGLPAGRRPICVVRSRTRSQATSVAGAVAWAREGTSDRTAAAAERRAVNKRIGKSRKELGVRHICAPLGGVISSTTPRLPCKGPGEARGRRRSGPPSRTSNAARAFYRATLRAGPKTAISASARHAIFPILRFLASSNWRFLPPAVALWNLSTPPC